MDAAVAVVNNFVDVDVSVIEVIKVAGVDVSVVVVGGRTGSSNCDEKDGARSLDDATVSVSLVRVSV